jgi:hypothetical protein
MRVGGNIVIRGIAAKEEIAHTPAREKSLVPAVAQGIANLIGEFARYHI